MLEQRGYLFLCENVGGNAFWLRQKLTVLVSTLYSTRDNGKCQRILS